MDLKIVPLTSWQRASIMNPYTHFSLYAGIASGKSFTGSHFVIWHVVNYPDLTGIVGANNYVQLSTATLRELFYWLNEYGFEFVIDRQPPARWGVKRQFKDYSNVLLIRQPWNGKVTTIFTRVMSDPAPLRGIEASWYWLDEVRDTPEESHDVVISRLRESDYIKGLITSTTNGEDWSFRRFTPKAGSMLYGSMHVRTEEAVFAGIISREFYEGLKASYSELMAAQELEAQHVNVFGGKAYYAASGINAKPRAPWGFTRYPDMNRPLIVGCDFNFDPAPHIWVVGQLDPTRRKIHWFREIAGNRMSTPAMTYKLISTFPGCHFRVFGDRSGARATTSNAGKPDYDQMAMVFRERNVIATIDQDQGNNPLVRNRVENVNRLLKNGLGQTAMTYDPEGCPNLHSDFKIVGWKKTLNKGQGKLDNCGDLNRTHASDAIGYACWKIFPPGSRGRIIPGNESLASQLLGPR